MLAKDSGDLSALANWPQMLQPKLDGIRASVVDGKLLTRTLKEVPNREVFNLLSDPALEGADGELIVGDPTADDAYRRTTSFVMASDKTGEPWAFHVFDKHDHDGPFKTRFADIEDWFGWGFDHPDLKGRIKVVPTTVVPSAAHVEAIEATYVEAGYEGVILRDPEAAYKFGRSGKKGPLLKVKRFIDFEAEVIGVYEEMHNANEAKTNALGRTERSSHQENKVGKGTLGGLIVQAINGPADGVEFRVGTGFDAAMRMGLWEEWHSNGTFRGRVAKIKSFPIGVKDKPRHPVFLGWRDVEVDG